MEIIAQVIAAAAMYAVVLVFCVLFGRNDWP
jgi:hypothetical protein